MEKLGYTWFPQNWNSSDRVFDLNLQQRGLYRELIDRAMSNNNEIPLNLKRFSRMFNEPEEVIQGVINTLRELSLIEVIDEEIITIPSCSKRIALVEKNRKNGAKGGAKKGNQNARKQPKNNPKTTQKQPTKQGKEKESKEKDIANAISKKNNADEVLQAAKQQQEINEKAVRFAKNLEDPKEQLWRDNFYMQQGFRKGSLGRLLQDFNKHLVLQPPDKPNYDYREYKTHFTHWVNKQNQMKKLEKHKL